jgi:hypothetical protein
MRRGECQDLLGETEGKKSLGITRRRWEDKIKMVLYEGE